MKELEPVVRHYESLSVRHQKFVEEMLAKASAYPSSAIMRLFIGAEEGSGLPKEKRLNTLVLMLPRRVLRRRLFTRVEVTEEEPVAAVCFRANELILLSAGNFNATKTFRQQFGRTPAEELLAHFLHSHDSNEFRTTFQRNPGQRLAGRIFGKYESLFNYLGEAEVKTGFNPKKENKLSGEKGARYTIAPNARNEIKRMVRLVE